MSFTNPSFEDPEISAGVEYDNVADDWGFTTSAFAWVQASFLPPNYFAETYDALWDSNQDSISAFEPSDISQGIEEDYEEWEFTITDPSLESATFNLAADLYESFGYEWPLRHKIIDKTRSIDADFALGGTPSTVHALLNEIKADHNLHIADATIHTIADVSNIITSADATDLATSITLATEIFNDVWDHVVDAPLNWHRDYSTGEIIKPTDVSLPLTTYDDCASAANHAFFFNQHFVWADNENHGYWETWGPIPPADPTKIMDFWGYPGFFQHATPSGVEEGYEDEWRDNQDAISEFTAPDLSAGSFGGDGGPYSVEDYEQTTTVPIVASTGGTGAEVDVEPTSDERVSYGGTFSGLIILQGRRRRTGAWLELDEVSTVPIDIDQVAGYRQLRNFTQSYSSGSPTCVVGWRPLFTL